jgi:hypothetical protein
MAFLEGAEIEEMRLLPGIHEELGFYLGYVKHSGGTTWLTESAPFLTDVLIILLTTLLLYWKPAIRFKNEILLFGYLSPIGDLIYNYQGGFWRAGTDVADLHLLLPNSIVHAFFIISIVVGMIGYFKLRRQNVPSTPLSSIQ